MSFKLKRPKFTNEPYSIKNEGAIDGIGVFADKFFKKGDFIGVAFEDEAKGLKFPQVDTRTPFGKSLNHQTNCNAVNKSENNQLNIYATKDINEGEEITVNYKNTPAYVKNAVNLKGYKD